MFDISGSALTTLVQQILLNKINVTRFILRPPANRNTLDPVFIAGLSDSTSAPHVVLTVTTLDQ